MRFVLAVMCLVLLVGTSHANWSYQLVGPVKVDVASETVVLDPRTSSVSDVVQLKSNSKSVVAYLDLSEIESAGGFWNSQWQAKLFRGSSPLMDEVVKAGFDGILIDKIDTYLDDRMNDLGKFVRRLDANAKELNPSWKVYVPESKQVKQDRLMSSIVDGYKQPDENEVKPEPPVVPPEVKPPVVVNPTDTVSWTEWWPEINWRVFALIVAVLVGLGLMRSWFVNRS